MSDTCLTAPQPGEGSAAAADLWWKRPLDMVLGTISLLLTLPLICGLAVVVMVGDGSPPFFAQERLALRGRSFRMWKLRPMRAGCEQATHQRAAADWFAGRPPGDPFKTLADPRITRVGRLLRRCDLDELPQLFNVLRGEMSLVGPRPAIPYELAHYRPGYFDRFSAPPGMTGLWQVTRRDGLSAAEMMELDLRYVREVSPWLDLEVLARTGPALLAMAAGRS